MHNWCIVRKIYLYMLYANFNKYDKDIYIYIFKSNTPNECRVVGNIVR